jgi:hypothetical protein
MVSKENHVGPYISDGPGDWDRGLHVLVGEDKFRGAERCKLFITVHQPDLTKNNRAATQWHRALIHYCFLTDPRTEKVMAEPKAANTSVLKVQLDSAMHIATVSESFNSTMTVC